MSVEVALPSPQNDAASYFWVLSRLHSPRCFALVRVRKKKLVTLTHHRPTSHGPCHPLCQSTVMTSQLPLANGDLPKRSAASASSEVMLYHPAPPIPARRGMHPVRHPRRLFTSLMPIATIIFAVRYWSENRLLCGSGEGSRHTSPCNMPCRGH